MIQYIVRYSMSKKGFTLIELLVVIAIIGVLSTIAFVALNRSREKAGVAKAQADTRQLALALELLFSDTGRWPAHSNQALPCPSGSETDPGHVPTITWRYKAFETFNLELYTSPPPGCAYMNLLHPWFGLTGLACGDDGDCTNDQTDPTGNSNEYPGWNGPYLGGFPPTDAWGNGYYLDGDYEEAGGRRVATVSKGPNMVQNYGPDDLWFRICKMQTQPPCTTNPCPCQQ